MTSKVDVGFRFACMDIRTLSTQISLRNWSEVTGESGIISAADRGECLRARV